MVSPARSAPVRYLLGSQPLYVLETLSRGVNGTQGSHYGIGYRGAATISGNVQIAAAISLRSNFFGDGWPGVGPRRISLKPTGEWMSNPGPRGRPCTGKRGEAMDPNLFAIDNERLFEVLVAIVVLSFFIERALAVVFESRWLVHRLSKKGLKEPISFLVSFLVVRHWDFDAFSIIFTKEHTQLWGHVLTAGIVAGGSKASIKFFHGVLGAMSTAEDDRQKLAKAKTEADAAIAARPGLVAQVEEAIRAASQAAAGAAEAAARAESAATKTGGNQ